MIRLRMTLMQAQINTKYEITRISGNGNARRRLLDMGFTPKTEIFVSGVAPFGGTVLVSLRESFIALREDAASLIEVARL